MLEIIRRLFEIIGRIVEKLSIVKASLFRLYAFVLAS
jgi:hypothetical protein